MLFADSDYPLVYFIDMTDDGRTTKTQFLFYVATFLFVLTGLACHSNYYYQ